MKVGAIIPAAGCGKRIGGSTPKQFIEFKGKPLLHHTLMVFSSCELVDYVILVMPQADADSQGKDWLSKYKIVKKIVVGGKQRQDSVYNGFNSLDELTEIVVVHDGVRPFTTPQMIISTVEEARKYGAAITAIPVSDTIKKVADGFVEKTIIRDGLWRVQTPQAFKYDLLKEAFQKAQRDSYYGTDEGSLVEYLGKPVRIVSGSELNMKITHKEDLIIGESLL
jgi:2-C-methyl-D-erythritol 4-phosphate cytidylyltransferase